MMRRIRIETLLALPTVVICAACSSLDPSGPGEHNDLEFTQHWPMQIEFPGMGSFGASCHVSLVESIPNEANLGLRGETLGFSIGLGLPMPPTQSRSFSAGDRVEFDQTWGVAYGKLEVDFVVQPIRAVQMTRTDNGVATLEFELGDELYRGDGAPADLGPVDGFSVRGALGVSCAVAESGVFVEEDPKFESQYCQQAIVEFGLEDLARLHLERKNSK